MPGFGNDSNNDRLAALRTTSEPERAGRQAGRRRPELMVAVIALAVGVVLLVAIAIPRGRAVQVATASSTTLTPTNNARVPSGMVLVAVPVEAGHIPGSVRPGDRVRIVVTPMPDGTGSVRVVPSVVTVQSIDSTASIEGTTVVSVVGDASIVAAIASSGPVHVFLVGERA